MNNITEIVAKAAHGANYCRLPITHPARAAYSDTDIARSWQPFARDEWDTLTERWAQAHAADTVMGWHAISGLLAAMMHRDSPPDYLVGMFELAKVVHQHKLDAAKLGALMARLEQEEVAA